MARSAEMRMALLVPTSIGGAEPVGRALEHAVEQELLRLRARVTTLSSLP